MTTTNNILNSKLCNTLMLLPTFICGEFTVSGFDRSHEVSSNNHWSEADITVVLSDQRPEGKPGKQNLI